MTVAGVVAVVLAGSASGCGADDDEQLVVLAASSLTDVFGEVERDFETEHPGIDVVTSYGGSSSLVAQLGGGAPADVLATADVATMARVDRGALATIPVVFARNALTIAVEPGNPLGVDALDDLRDVPVVVLAAPEVPAGEYARTVLACAGVELAPASLEQNVRAAAAKVELGEADAAIVYRTDVGAGLAAVEIDDACNVEAEYPIAAVSDRSAARDFVEFVLGESGRATLTAAGFEVP